MLIRIYLLAFLFSTTFLFSNDFNFSSEELSWIETKKSITVSNQVNWYPYAFNRNGVSEGFLVDYIQLLSNYAGLEVVFITDSWPNLLSKFEKSELDLILPIAMEKNYKLENFYSHKVLDIKYALITKIKDKNIISLEMLKDKRLALVKGRKSSELIKEKHHDIKIIEFNTPLEALEAVAFDLADATIDDYYAATVMINDNMLSNLHVNSNLFLDYNPEELYMMSKEKKLISILNKVLKNIDKEKVFAIKSKWNRNVQIMKNNNIALNYEEKKYLENKQKITMCIDPDWMPLEKNKNGKHIGMSSDYIKLIQDKIDIPIEMVDTKTWLESIEYAKQRKCDIYSLVMPTPERKLYMNFTKPYLQIPLVLVTRNDEIFYSDVALIKNKKIGIVKGYAYGEILQVKYPTLNLIEVNSLQDGLNKVEKNELFGFIGTLATVGYHIQKSYIGQLKITGKFEEKWNLGIGTRNDEPLLLSIFEKAIDAIEPEKHQEILNKWISVNFEKPSDYSFLLKILGFLGVVFLLLLYRQSQLKKYNEQLQKLSTTDSLTKVYNRLKLDEILEYEKKNFQRYYRPFCVVLLDIDDFKDINDKFGHSVGDSFLVELAELLNKNKRNTDSLGRWGGEEFLIILPECDIEGAHKVAQKLKNTIEEHIFKIVGHKTASFGIAQIREGEDINTLFDRVDNALYTSKQQGKNRVTIDL